MFYALYPINLSSSLNHLTTDVDKWWPSTLELSEEILAVIIFVIINHPSISTVMMSWFANHDDDSSSISSIGTKNWLLSTSQDFFAKIHRFCWMILSMVQIFPLCTLCDGYACLFLVSAYDLVVTQVKKYGPFSGRRNTYRFEWSFGP